jgi:mRNA interferase RelE/StbE
VASYRIELKRSAAKEIAKIKNEGERRRIVDRIESLGSDPRPHGSEKLSGSDHYRVRQGQYRIIYSIYEEVLWIEIVKVGHRRDVYR